MALQDQEQETLHGRERSVTEDGVEGGGRKRVRHEKLLYQEESDMRGRVALW